MYDAASDDDKELTDPTFQRYAAKFRQCLANLRVEADRCGLKIPEIMRYPGYISAEQILSRVKRSPILRRFRRDTESDERVFMLVTEFCEDERKKLVGCDQAIVMYSETPSACN